MDYQIYATVFISILVAINAPGVVPLFISLTEDMVEERKRVATQSVLTAFLVATGFILLGRIVFSAVGIEVEDFMIGGGVLLLVFSIVDIVFPDSRGRHLISPTMGVVPIGTPLLAGPATLTTALVLVGNYGYFPVILSLFLNLFIAWLLLFKAEFLIRIIGLNGARAFAKVASLLLAAIAVKMIRSGLFEILKLH
ncbi:MAG TPA: MarC family protein [Dissulfurispiraceae bacterium]|nr:MarC family protein [Dissulfurispiraceae bacterium]